MTDLANLNSDGLKLDIDKLKTTPVGSSKLSEVVKLLKGLNIMNYLKGLIILILLILATQLKKMTIGGLFQETLFTF